MNGQKSLRSMDAQEFVRRLNLSSGQHDTHYVFWIGAGCSISSGIPGAATLVADRWLPQLQQVRGAAGRDMGEWAEEAFPGYDPDNPAAMYGAVMEELFLQPEARQREVEALCDGRFPGFGYAVLAALLARRDGLFNVALTTNFDDLIADAMYVFTEARPLVIPDEALAGFIRPTRLRPLVVKVHGDHRLSPRNTQTETATLKKGISVGIGDLLQDRGVIFVGYGGNDQGISELLHSLPAQALPLGVWWASRSEPSGVLRDWLEARSAIWVKTPGFDELMLLFQSEFDLQHPEATKFERLFGSYFDTYRKLEKRVKSIPDSDPQASSLKDATARAQAVATDWSAVLFQAGLVQEEDPERAEDLYRKGIEEFPRAMLLHATYGEFLLDQGKFAEATAVSDRALALDPQDANLLKIHGLALVASGDMANGLRAFTKWVELRPDSVSARANYGIYLAMSGDKDSAREQLEIALEHQPSDPFALAFVAALLDELGEHQEAVSFHERAADEAFEVPAIHVNYARCLLGLDRPVEALKEVEICLDLISPTSLPTLLEALFYKLVIRLQEGKEGAASETLCDLKRRLLAGARCPAWGLHPAVGFAERAQVSDAEWMAPLAAVIGNKRDSDVLQSWSRWDSCEDQ